MPEEKQPEEKQEKKEEKPTPKDNLVVTKHSVTIGTKEIKYTVTAGTMVGKRKPPIVRRKRKARSRAPRSSLWRTPKMATRRRRNVRLRSRLTRQTGFIIRVAAFGSAGAAPCCLAG